MRKRKHSCDRCEQPYWDTKENVIEREYHCEPCWAIELAERKESEDKFIKAVRDGLNAENQATFDTYDREMQLALAYKAYEDGMIKWVLGGKTLEEVKHANS